MNGDLVAAFMVGNKLFLTKINMLVKITGKQLIYQMLNWTSLAEIK
jgi:hypothetical protein